jgi:hypothetical protein
MDAANLRRGAAFVEWSTAGTTLAALLFLAAGV